MTRWQLYWLCDVGKKGIKQNKNRLMPLRFCWPVLLKCHNESITRCFVLKEREIHRDYYNKVFLSQLYYHDTYGILLFKMHFLTPTALKMSFLCVMEKNEDDTSIYKVAKNVPIDCDLISYYGKKQRCLNQKGHVQLAGDVRGDAKLAYCLATLVLMSPVQTVHSCLVGFTRKFFFYKSQTLTSVPQLWLCLIRMTVRSIY